MPGSVPDRSGPGMATPPVTATAWTGLGPCPGSASVAKHLDQLFGGRRPGQASACLVDAAGEFADRAAGGERVFTVYEDGG